MIDKDVEPSIKKSLLKRIDSLKENDGEFSELSERIDEVSKKMSKFITKKYKNISKISPKIIGIENGFNITDKDTDYFLKFSEKEKDNLRNDISSIRRIREAACLSIYGKDIAVQPSVYGITNGLCKNLLDLEEKNYNNNTNENTISISITKKISSNCCDLRTYVDRNKDEDVFIIPENLLKIIINSILLGTCDVRAANIVVDCTDKKHPKAFLVDLMIPEDSNKFHFCDIPAILKILNIPNEYFDYVLPKNSKIIKQTKSEILADKDDYFKIIKYIFLLTQGFSITKGRISPTALRESNNITEIIINQMIFDRNKDTYIQEINTTINDIVKNILNELSKIESKNGNKTKFLAAKEEYLKLALSNSILLDTLSFYNFNNKILSPDTVKKIFEKLKTVRFNNQFLKSLDARKLQEEKQGKFVDIVNKYRHTLKKIITSYKEQFKIDEYNQLKLEERIKKQNIKEKFINDDKKEIQLPSF